MRMQLFDIDTGRKLIRKADISIQKQGTSRLKELTFMHTRLIDINTFTITPVHFERKIKMAWPQQRFDIKKKT